jgi:hypothetical protein
MNISLNKTNIFACYIESFVLFFSIEDLDRTLEEYEYTSMSEAYISITKQRIENGSQSLRIK